MIKERPMIYIIDYLHEYDYPEVVVSANHDTNVLMCKIMYYLDRNHKSANIHNKIKYTMIDRLAFELDITRDKLLRSFNRLKKLGYVDFWVDSFGGMEETKFSKYCGVKKGATRMKAYLTEIGKLELYKAINKTDIPLKDEYIEIYG